MMRSAAVRAVFVVSLAALVAAQPLDRLTGLVVTDRGEPIRDAAVRVEALFGFAGGDFPGQRTFAATANAKGAWSLIAFKSGIWIFEASAPGHVPDAVVLPFHLVLPPGSGLANMDTAWKPVLKPTPLPAGDDGAQLAEAAAAALAGRPERATPLLARLADSTNADVLVAAGRICLVLRDGPAARPFFRRALERDPASFRAALGMGSTALMQRDVDAAARAFGEARTRTKDSGERGYLAAAITELNKAHNVMKGTY